MQVHSFGDEDETGLVRSLAVLDDGDLLVVATQQGRTVVERCSYRGEPLSKFTPTGVPPEFASRFNPDVVVYKKGLVYLADRAGLKILVTDTEGAFKASYDLAKILGQKKKSEKKHGSTEDLSINGFSVDDDGNLLLTAPVLFYVYVISPRGDVTGFGTRGSTAGKFNIVGGVTTDPKGNIWVTDTLRAVVLVFDKHFEYLGEFGYRGYARNALVAPLELAVGKDGKVFVAQSADRGVSVFRVSLDQ
jgi:DNA-binding beta-propeller fold protein YncE